MATDFLKAGYDKILALLQASTAASSVKSWTTFNDSPDVLESVELVQARNKNQLPQVVIDLASYRDSGQTKTRNLATLGSGSVTWLRTIEATYNVSILVDSPKLSVMTTIVASFQTALNNAGVSDLSISGCKAYFGPTQYRNRRTARSESALSSFRRLGELVVPMTIDFRGETQNT